MWRKPNLITEDVDSLLEDEIMSVNYITPAPIPVPTPAPTPGPTPSQPPSKGCVIERCYYGKSCDIFPVW